MDNELEAYLANLGISDDEKIERTPKSQSESELMGLEPASDSGEESLSNRPDIILEEFLSGLLKFFGPGFYASASLHGDTVLVDLSSRDLSRVIGKEGQTLMAIELLSNTYLSRKTERRRYRVVVDAAGYRDRYENRLIGQAMKAAAEVRRNGGEVELGLMSPADRRVVHMVLADDPDVMTESTGEGRERHVVVKVRTKQEETEDIQELENQENA